MSTPESTSDPEIKSGIDQKRPLLTRIVIPAIVTAVGVGIAFFFMTTKPEPATAPHPRTARLVETTTVSPTTHRIEIEAMGLVQAKSIIQLKPRISGQIVGESSHLVPGKTVMEGHMIYRIDPSDYELTLQSQEAGYQQARALYMIEEGQQSVAKADYEMTGQTLSGAALDLVLRKPQLMQAEANERSTEAQLEIAKLNLSRTEIAAPFNALILSKTESIGSIVNTGSTLATLADCSEFWVELEIPVRDTRWIASEDEIHGEDGRKVRIYDELAWGKGVYRDGVLVSLSNHVDPESKMAKATVSVSDPLALLPENQGKPRLMLGAFVRASIEGRELDDVVVLKRDYLRLDNIVWTLGEENRLKFTKVEVEYSGVDNVVLSGSLAPDTRIVTSNLSVPIEGMLLRYENSADPSVSKETNPQY